MHLRCMWACMRLVCDMYETCLSCDTDNYFSCHWPHLLRGGQSSLLKARRYPAFEFSLENLT